MSSLERWPLFTVSCIERFHCIFVTRTNMVQCNKCCCQLYSWDYTITTEYSRVVYVVCVYAYVRMSTQYYISAALNPSMRALCVGMTFEWWCM